MTNKAFNLGLKGVDWFLTLYTFQEDILLDMTLMWSNTPALAMPMLLKFYWILVIAFVVHQYPEMYFMRVKNVSR